MAVRKKRPRADKKRREPASGRLRINVSNALRTLKRSARTQLDRERGPSLWIMPWNGSKQPEVAGGRTFPRASLLGLPPELRQEILYQSCQVKELKADARTHYTKTPCRVKRTMASRGQNRPDSDLLAKFNLNTREGELVAMLSKKVGTLCRTSPLIRQDMEYVCKRWQFELEKLLNRDLPFRLYKSKLPKILEGMQWLHTPSVTAALRARHEENVINGKDRRGSTKRPQKCWYCTERHYGIDPVCPMARQSPENWRQMTKVVGGRRGRKAAKHTPTARKIVFDDT
jgi:hypothetical protein